MKSDIEWYAKADMSKYSGKYVAILNRRIIASGKDAKKVLEEAKKKKLSKRYFIAKIDNGETFVLSFKVGVVLNGRISLQERKV